MVVKIKREIVFNIWIKFLLISILIIRRLWRTQFYPQLELSYINLFNIRSFFFRISTSLRYTNIIFISIVLPVTFFVLSYRKIYIDHYNNKKFLIITIIFFFSMILLVTRRSFINFIIGWDGLGLTSICLIIFYPNKTSLYNSVLTIFFNRLGDVILILALRIVISDYSEKINWNFIRLNILLILTICAFSKRAQFPLSRWLPAAISAPTPISAIVHSSTLVTAGVYILCLIEIFLFQTNLIFFPLVIRVITFLLGGLIRSIEKDLKKIVAFSTISQIRIIIRFCLIIRVKVCFIHIIFHAFFKTMLFTCCGSIFLINYRTQLRRVLNFKKIEKFYSLNFFLRIFIITGLIFSTSFFSKDLAIEIRIGSKSNYQFVVLIVGRLATLMYCSLLVSNNKNWTSNFSFFEEKKNSVLSFLIFANIMVFSSFLIKRGRFTESYPFIRKREILFILIIFFLVTLMKFKKGIVIKIIIPGVFLIKEYSYSLVGYLVNEGLKEKTKRDLIIFKPNLLSGVRNKRNMTKIRMILVILTILILCTIYSFSLSGTWYWSYQRNRINFKIWEWKTHVFITPKILVRAFKPGIFIKASKSYQRDGVVEIRSFLESLLGLNLFINNESLNRATPKAVGV